MATRETVEFERRKLLMDFYSSELSTHSRLIVGFSVILLTLVEIILDLDKSIFGVRYIAYPGVFLLSFALWYLFMRHLLYGVLAHSILVATLEEENRNLLATVAQATGRDALTKKMLFVFPTSLYLSYDDGKRNTRKENVAGFALCIALALATTTLLIWLVDYEFITILLPFLPKAVSAS